MILAGQVFSAQQRLDKPGLLLPLEAEITLKENDAVCQVAAG
ncbi:MAG: hypothetical protein U0Y68_01200 [Blastocatellia bacterium]